MHVSTFVLRQRSFPQSTALQGCNITEAYQEFSSLVHFVTFLLLSVFSLFPCTTEHHILIVTCVMFLCTNWVLYSCSQYVQCSCVPPGYHIPAHNLCDVLLLSYYLSSPLSPLMTFLLWSSDPVQCSLHLIIDCRSCKRLLGLPKIDHTCLKWMLHSTCTHVIMATRWCKVRQVVIEFSWCEKDNQIKEGLRLVSWSLSGEIKMSLGKPKKWPNQKV